MGDNTALCGGERDVEGERGSASAGGATPEVEGGTTFLPFEREETVAALAAFKREAKGAGAEEGVTYVEEEATAAGVFGRESGRRAAVAWGGEGAGVEEAAPAEVEGEGGESQGGGIGGFSQIVALSSFEVSFRKTITLRLKMTRSLALGADL